MLGNGKRYGTVSDRDSKGSEVKWVMVGYCGLLWALCAALKGLYTERTGTKTHSDERKS